MTDEEKNAIEIIKFLQEKCMLENGRGVMPIYRIDDLANAIDTILNLIEKQSKEIEELTDKNKKLKDKAKELIFEKQELTSALLDSTPNDKIKAKIEEVKDGAFDAKIVLQSLLEKE